MAAPTNSDRPFFESLSQAAATLNLNAGTNGNASQQFGNLSLTGGAANIILAPNGSNTMGMTLGNAWSRSRAASHSTSQPPTGSATVSLERHALDS